MRSPPYPAALLSLLLVTAGCGLAPDDRQHDAYVRQLQPLLVENALLADQVLGLAARVYDTPDIAPGALLTTWQADVVPVAEHLHSQASFVEPPEAWVQQHAALVDIWSDRAGAYRALAESARAADADGWRSARALADGVKLREEEWFRTTNQALASQGLVLDPFP